jgi:hypothetical protein
LPERHEENAEELAVMLFPLNNKLADLSFPMNRKPVSNPGKQQIQCGNDFIAFAF